MRRARLSILLMTLGLLLVGSSCTVTGTARATYHTPSAIELVEVRPGVWVAVDYHRPLFYADGYYWMWRDGVWMRSYSYYGGSWVVVHYSYVPYSLRHLDYHPRYYVRYRPPPNRVRYTAPRVRDHRRGAAAPVRVRDHRSRDDGPRVRDHRRDRDDGPRVRDHRRDRDDGPRVRDHRQRDAERDHTRSRAKRGSDARRDDGPRVRDHRSPRRDSRPSRSRSRDHERVPARRGRPR